MQRINNTVIIILQRLRSCAGILPHNWDHRQQAQVRDPQWPKSVLQEQLRRYQGLLL